MRTCLQEDCLQVRFFLVPRRYFKQEEATLYDVYPKPPAPIVWYLYSFLRVGFD